ncbi:unnamed protein product [Ranitomeya imitator]|uniref:Carboxylesterase type B domain-containing protein n=1 Tax=Ranitomeya imitator TaxID=111125 RepID=A0ABN9MHM6_9NEOB|nr:unnamed protein product [Ranitomeya imitator]
MTERSCPAPKSSCDPQLRVGTPSGIPQSLETPVPPRNIAALWWISPVISPSLGSRQGAPAVSLQTLTPYNVGLIRRAITQSGVGLLPVGDPREPLMWAKQLATNVGCPVDDTATLVNCLKQTDPEGHHPGISAATANPRVSPGALFGLLSGHAMEILFLMSRAICSKMLQNVDYRSPDVNNMAGHLFAGM